MPYVVPSFREVLGDLVADFANRFPKANVSRLSGHWKRLAVFAGGAAALHRHLQVIARDLMPDTAVGAWLDRHGRIYGVKRKAATPAKKAKALRLVGTVATPFTAGQQLTSPDRLLYQLAESGSIPAAGFVDVDVIASTQGSLTRKSKGTVFTWTSPPAGMESLAVLQLDLDEGGTDTELDGPYRARILDTIAMPGMGGNAQDFRAWAKELSWCVEAYVWPLRGGLGSVHLVALKAGEGAARIPTAAERAEAQAYLDAKRPTGYPDFLVLAPVAEPTDIHMRVVQEDDPAFAWDWDDDASTPTVTAFNPATRTLTLTPTRPPDLRVGGRIVYAGASHNSGKAHVVEAFGLAANQVILRADPELTTNPPQVGDPVYAGGPLTEPVRSALMGHVNGLGPARWDSASLFNFSYGSSYWEGTLRPPKLYAAAQRVNGVLDTELVVPTANVVPANVAPQPTVGLLVARQIIVRRGSWKG